MTLMLRRGVALVTTALVLIAVSLVVLRPGPARADVPTPNGCGSAGSSFSALVPNAPFGFDFEAACDQHDMCYGAGDGKSFCDQQFLDNLDDVCDDNALCDGLAYLYYLAVHVFGQGAYDQATDQRLTDLINAINGCGDDSGCVDNAVDAYNLDALVSQLLGCGDDAACEQQVNDSFGGTQPTDPCADGACSGDPDPGSGDPGSGDPDPGSGDPDPGSGDPDPGSGDPDPGSGDPGSGDPAAAIQEAAAGAAEVTRSPSS